MASHTVLGDKVRVYQRPNSSLWQCSTYLEGREWRVSTKTDSLAQAKEFAEDWYLELRGKSRAGLLKTERTFADAAKQFVVEYVALTNGERNPRYVKDHEARLDNHLLPYFGKTSLSAVTAGVVQQYRVMRSRPHEETGKVPTRSTLHHETVTLRQVMKTALRPDEANRLEYRNVTIEKDEDGDRILLIEVRGKRGVGYCNSTEGAVHPFERLVARNNPKPTDLVFPQDHKKQFNRALDDCDLKADREGNKRSAYSLRHTYICLRLLEGADIYQIAKNCRTSVEMIEKHYAIHLKNTLDAKAINVKRRKAVLTPAE